MAQFDLAQYDILDLILADAMPDEEKLNILESYFDAYNMLVTKEFGAELSEKDQDAMEELMKDPTVTTDIFMKFLTDRMPHMEAKIIYFTLEYKKMFILNVYKNKLDEYKGNTKADGYAAWEQIYKDAQADNWEEVTRLLEVLKSRYGEKSATA